MTAGMQETKGALPPVASVALFALPPGALLLCPGCSIVDGGVTITSSAAATVLAAGVTNKPGVGVGATTTAGVGTAGAAVPELLPTMLGTDMGPCPPCACQFASDCIISGRRAFIVFATSSWTSCGSMFTYSLVHEHKGRLLRSFSPCVPSNQTAPPVFHNIRTNLGPHQSRPHGRMMMA